MNKIILIVVLQMLAFGSQISPTTTVNLQGSKTIQCAQYANSFYENADSEDYYDLQYSALSFIQIVNNCEYDNDDVIIAKMVDVKLQKFVK
jgi:hypothetical protein